MLMVIGTAKLGEGALEAGREALDTMITASRAEEGCIDYAYSIDILDPTIMRITEKWASMQDLEAHFAMPHMADFQAAMAANPPQGVEAKFYEVTEVTPPR